MIGTVLIVLACSVVLLIVLGLWAGHAGVKDLELSRKLERGRDVLDSYRESWNYHSQAVDEAAAICGELSGGDDSHVFLALAYKQREEDRVRLEAVLLVQKDTLTGWLKSLRPLHGRVRWDRMRRCQLMELYSEVSRSLDADISSAQSLDAALKMCLDAIDSHIVKAQTPQPIEGGSAEIHKRFGLQRQHEVGRAVLARIYADQQEARIAVN